MKKPFSGERRIMARPRIEINKINFEKLCGLQCTLDEIADFFDCSPDTIERWCKREYKRGFAEVFKQKRGKGKIALRRMQWQSAEDGNVTMQIFLGKQFLGQSDKIEANVDASLENEKSKLDELIEQRKSRRHESK